MASADHSSESLITQLRQQLILAQVRIMELEDVRDEIVPKLAETDRLLSEAQTLVESKVDQADHLTQVTADLQKQSAHLQHIQHITHTALEETRRELTAKDGQIEALLSETELLQTLIGQLSEETITKLQTITHLETELNSSHHQTAKHVARIQQLDLEQRAMKTSRSWRWTAWMRAIERRFR